MNRYEYVNEQIYAFQHEYKMLIMGQMTAEQLPTESVQGILYYMLQQLMDCYHSQLMFNNHIEFLDEMIEDYNFDVYLGVMSEEDEDTYGMDNMLRAANPILQIMDTLNAENYQMSIYTDKITNSVKSLFARLFHERQEAIHFFGDEISLDKAFELWMKDKFMNTLVSNIICYNETDDEEDRIQTVIDELFIDKYSSNNLSMEVVGDEELPFG